MKINQSRNNHIYVLDDLRGIAILTVVFYHYFFVYFKKIGVSSSFYDYYSLFNDYLNFGVYGISLFFLVSGFVIPMSLKGENNKTIIYNFFIRRFFRLYPTYWFAIILIVFVILTFKDSDAYTTRQILFNFTMFQDIFRVSHIDGVFWTLMIELKFYILTAIFFYIGVLNKIHYIIFLFLVISILTLFFGFFYGKGLANGLFAYLMLMYLGSAFYYFYKGLLRKKILNILIVSVFIYFALNHLVLIGSTEYGLKIGYSIATCLSILTFIFTINFEKTISKFTTFFGNISYSLYLIHQVLGFFIISILFDNFFSQLVTFLLLTIVSYLIFKYIEKPTNKFGHKYVKK